MAVPKFGSCKTWHPVKGGNSNAISSAVFNCISELVGFRECNTRPALLSTGFLWLLNWWERAVMKKVALPARVMNISLD